MHTDRYPDSYYPKFQTDVRSRNYIKNSVKMSQISKIEVNRMHSKLEMSLYAATQNNTQ